MVSLIGFVQTNLKGTQKDTHGVDLPRLTCQSLLDLRRGKDPQRIWQRRLGREDNSLDKKKLRASDLGTDHVRNQSGQPTGNQAPQIPCADTFPLEEVCHSLSLVRMVPLYITLVFVLDRQSTKFGCITVATALSCIRLARALVGSQVREP